jgi:hypothetical protein
MKLPKILLTIAAAVGLTAAANAQPGLSYTFNTDAEGFQNVTWQAASPAGWGGIPTVKQSHTAGGWQMMLTKEFAWGPGGGSANQQLEMQALANSGGGRLRFDVMVDFFSFEPLGSQTWFQLNLVGNSDGAKGWTQIDKLVEGWQNPGQMDLRTWHFDLPFSSLGWDAGDTWFQFWTGANSDGTVPVNFYLDNVVLVPEPSVFALAGLGLALLIFRRK